MTSSDLDLRLQRFRSRRDEYPHALASALIEAGRSNDALEVIHLGLLDDEADLELLTLEGRAFYAQGDLQQAQRSLLKAAKIDPRNKEPYRWLAQVLIERGDAARAVQVLERAIALDPSDATLRQSLTRAQRLALVAAQKGTAPKPSRPTSNAPPARAASSAEPRKPARSRDSRDALRNLSERAVSEPRASASPSTLGAAVQRTPANTNAPARGGAEAGRAPALRARARGPEAAAHDAIAEDLMREPLSEPGSQPWPTAAGQRAQGPGHALPFDDETERDDETPTTAVEVPGELRSYLRGEAAPRDQRAQRPLYADDDDEDEGSEPTSIMASEREIELLRDDGRRPHRGVTPGERDGAGRLVRQAAPAQAEGSAREPAARPSAKAEPARPARLFASPEPVVAARPARAGEPRPSARAEERPPGSDSTQGGAREAREPFSRSLRKQPSDRPPPAQQPSPSHEAPAPHEHGLHEQDSNEHDTLIGSTHDLAEPGHAEPPEQVLGLLEQQGVFEPPGREPVAQQRWIGTQEVPREGTPMKRALLLGWGVAMLAALGGYFGFRTWLDGRRAEATVVVQQARADVLDGQHESLVSAERRLAQARALDPKSSAALSELLFVQVLRALDETGDFGAVRETLARAEQLALDTPLVAVARTLVRTPEQRKGEADAVLARVEKGAAVDQGAQEDARAALLGAKLAQHTGQVDLQIQLTSRATMLEPQLASAWLLRGEQARAAGQLEQAYEAFDKALGADKHQLRAELWIAVLEAKAAETPALLQKLDALSARVERGSESDKLLALGVRAFGNLALGDGDQAKRALGAGSSLRVDDPEVLAFFSEQALRAGEPALAYRVARAASSAGGDAARYQATVAAALLQQGDGDAALSALAGMGEGHGALALARASAALLGDSREALEAAKKELASYRVTPVGKDDVDGASLLMRVDLRLGANVESLLPAARALVQRAPGSAASHMSLAAALIAAGQGVLAVEALEPALRLSPGLSDVHYLLGQAQRLAGRPNEARLSFERSVAIAPGHVEARRALGRTLLDGGEFAAALTLFRGLEGVAGNVASLGVAETLIAQGAENEAQQQLDALPELVKASAAAQTLRARLDLLRARPGDALARLEPLVGEDAETRTADTLALYGDALYAADKVDSAAGAYESALELDEAHPDALLGRAVTAVRADKPDQALAFIARADAALTLRMRPPSARALLLTTAAHAELQKNQAESARERLSRATALPGVPSEAFFWYGEALTKLKDASASEQYARYLSVAPTGPYAARAKRSLGQR